MISNRYRVDRRKSVEVLENFLAKKDVKVADESQWLKVIRVDCVLSDAAFLGWYVTKCHHRVIPSTDFALQSCRQRSRDTFRPNYKLLLRLCFQLPIYDVDR